MKKSIWTRGYDWGTRNKHKDLRDNRIIATAFEAGWRSAKRRPRPVAPAEDFDHLYHFHSVLENQRKCLAGKCPGF